MNKYQKISDNIDKYDLSKKDNILFSNKTKWVVTEKIHGSNFAIYYRDGKIEFSKRNKILESDEWFYNYHLIKQKLIDNIILLSNIMNEKNLVVYGELFGGWYPNDCKNWKGSNDIRINSKGICIVPFEEKAIQEGIYYSPNIEYFIFDIGIIKNKIEYVDFVTMEKYLKQTKFNYTKPLKIGTFSEVRNFNIDFDSYIPEELGLDLLPPKTNIAEGIVIKPVNTYFIKDKKNDDVRCIIKVKNKQFLEVLDDFDINEANKSYKFIFTKLVNQNRLQCVLSKNGLLSESSKDIILKELEEDVWNDFYGSYSNINISNYEDASNFVSAMCKNIINLNLSIT